MTYENEEFLRVQIAEGQKKLKDSEQKLRDLGHTPVCDESGRLVEWRATNGHKISQRQAHYMDY